MAQPRFNGRGFNNPIDPLGFHAESRHRVNPNISRSFMSDEGNYRADKIIHSSFSLSVINLTGRDNPYSIFFDYDGGRLKAYSLAIYGVPITTLTYKFKF